MKKEQLSLHLSSGRYTSIPCSGLTKWKLEKTKRAKLKKKKRFHRQTKTGRTNERRPHLHGDIFFVLYFTTAHDVHLKGGAI